MLKLNFLPSWLLLTVVLSSFCSADDIEIYTDYSGDQGAENHNILFSVDTSGSMGGNVTTTYTGGDYDPTNTYGDGSDSDRVYIYDTSLNYTGESFLLAQSKCSSMNTLFASNSRYPVHSGTIAEWQKTTDTVVVPGACRNEYQQPKNYNFSGTIKKNDKVYQMVPIKKGQRFQVIIRASRQVSNVRIFTSKPNRKNWNTYCKPSNKQRDYTCQNTSQKDDHTELWVYFKSKDKNSINYDIGIFTDGSYGEVCDPDTEEKRDTNDWAFDLKGADDLDNIIECKADEGIHGINDSSTDTYVQDCPHGTVCNNPRYTNSYSSRITYLRPTQLFVPGNFHNFLQEGGDVDDLSSLPEADGSSYCNWSSRRDVIFRDSDTGNILQCKQKLEVMKTAITNILDTLENSPINIGLQRFNRNGAGGTVIDAVADINGNKDDFVKKLNALNASGVTPLQETLWESYKYFSGQARDQGYSTGTSSESTDASAMSGSYYKTPVTSACQTNNVIFLTDGAPVSDTGKASNIKSLSGESCNSSKSGDCLDELAGAMNRLDLINSIPGHNNVRTYTIGFDIDLPILVDTAQKGGGQNFTASDTTQLSLAFQNIIIDILSDASTFVAPAVSVNAFNELRHRDELYFALFKPAGAPDWNGNVKKYRLLNSEVVDSQGNPAVDATTGFFKDTAKSFWSDDTDGASVVLGGAASRLGTDRRVYTETPTGLEKLDTTFADNLESSSTSNAIKNAFSPSTLDTDSFTPTEVIRWMVGEDVLNTNGNGSVTDANSFIGDALHSKPVVVTYSGDADSPNDVMFYMTNLGMLHAINPDDSSGTELWSYWPEEHRNNAGIYMDPGNQYLHEYGLDGQMTFVVEETADSNSTDFELDNVQVYFGERRGGSHYYGLDVSNARSTAFGSSAKLDNSYDTPFKVLWKITGALKADGDRTDYDYSNSNISSGFGDLALTWAKPFDTVMQYTSNSSKEEKDVLIVSGGYDPVHDNTAYNPKNLDDKESEYGNAIYFIDRETGEIAFSIGNNKDTRTAVEHSVHADLHYSIPAEPAVIDINRDGFVDTLIFVDIVGDVWRADINVDLDIDEEGYVTVGKIASLSDLSDSRKFFNSVDVSVSSVASGSNNLNLLVGSGYRPHPREIETENNRFYVLFDHNIQAPTLSQDEEDDRYNYFAEEAGNEISYRQIEHDDLLEIDFGEKVGPNTKRLDNSGQPTNFKISGYYFDFEQGEKLLQSTTTLNNVAYFATYTPTGGSTAGSCGGGTLGASRFYGINLLNGTSALEEDYLESARPGLPPEISFIIPPAHEDRVEGEVNDDEQILILLGPEKVNVTAGKTNDVKKVYWREEQK